MKLFTWLKKHDVRLHAVTRATFDPVHPEPRWRCEILGFHTPDAAHRRPAVFILTAHGLDAYVVGFGDDSDEAFGNAVNQLIGKRVRVVLYEQSRLLTVPRNLTV
ncbi:MAG TPA: hypothetical protein VJ553_06500 [Candidatus Paceibacterota bacterium]|nr:hypothetical protein [Candidatus Paceibacterota bacterium]